jgi:hypothetical protein
MMFAAELIRPQSIMRLGAKRKPVLALANDVMARSFVIERRPMMNVRATHATCLPYARFSLF